VLWEQTPILKAPARPATKEPWQRLRFRHKLTGFDHLTFDHSPFTRNSPSTGKSRDLLGGGGEKPHVDRTLLPCLAPQDTFSAVSCFASIFAYQTCENSRRLLAMLSPPRYRPQQLGLALTYLAFLGSLTA
jgi:hypothetical protein